MAETLIAGAIDIGGSKTIVGLVDNDGRILTKRQFHTPVSDDPQTTINKCVEELKDCLQKSDLSQKDIYGIGVSAPGLVEPRKGVLIEAPYAGWKNVAIGEPLGKHWPSIDTRVANDVNACALGESFFGMGRDYRNFLWVTISTGIGGGLLVNGNVYEGEHQIAGEIGHFVVDWENGRRCGCGNKGCLEAHASGNAIAEITKDTIKRDGPKSELAVFFRDHQLEVTAAHCALAAYQSIPAAREIFRQAGQSIGKAFSYAVNLINPGAIIVGGGVSQSFDLMEQEIKQVVRSAVIGESNRSMPILKTALGYEAAFLGAASLVFSSSNNR